MMEVNNQDQLHIHSSSHNNDHADVFTHAVDDEEEVPVEAGIVIADHNQVITSVNNGFSHLTGYTRQEALGRTCNFLQGLETNPSAVAEIRRSLAENKFCRIGILNYRKDGTPFWNLLTLSPMFDGTGHVTNYVGIQMQMNQRGDYVDRPLATFPWSRLGEGMKRVRPQKSNKSSIRTQRRPLLSIVDISDSSSNTLGSGNGHTLNKISQNGDSKINGDHGPHEKANGHRHSNGNGHKKVSSPVQDVDVDVDLQHSAKRRKEGGKFKIEEIEQDDDDDDDEKSKKNVDTRPNTVSFVAETLLPTIKGKYRVRVYRDFSRPSRESEIMVIIHGDISGLHCVPMRVHDQCFTSEVLGSLKCDCREQLEYAMDYIRDGFPPTAVTSPPSSPSQHSFLSSPLPCTCSPPTDRESQSDDNTNTTTSTENPEKPSKQSDKKPGQGIGLVIYMPQEGRGIGLGNKIKAYSVQERGLDTVDANRILGFADDVREYFAVPWILTELGVRSVRLLTNNPRKVETLRALGVDIESRIPVHIDPNPHSSNYLDAKRSRMGHFRPADIN